MRLHEAAPKLIIQEQTKDKVKVSSYWPVPELTRAELTLGRLHFPFDEVLKRSSPAGVSMIDHFLHLVFLFSFNKVRGWPRIVRPICVHFAIGR